MADDLLPILTRFHQEVLLPDMKRLVGESASGLRDEMNSRFREVFGHFDSLYQRLDRLEIEYQMIVAGLKRIEDNWSAEKATLRAEVASLRARVNGLQEQVRVLEERLEG